MWGGGGGGRADTSEAKKSQSASGMHRKGHMLLLTP